jgi:hypothetical protein
MSRRLKRWLAGLTGTVVVIVPAVIILTHWMGASSTGTVQLGTAANQQAPPQSPAPPLQLTTPYFVTTLPSDFTEKRRDEPAGNSAIQLELVADANGQADQQFAVTIGTLPSGGIAALGDYHLRTADRATYRPFTASYLPASAAAFQNMGSSPAISIFWPHGSSYAEVAVSTSGGANMQQLAATLSDALQAWQWK